MFRPGQRYYLCCPEYYLSYSLEVQLVKVRVCCHLTKDSIDKPWCKTTVIRNNCCSSVCIVSIRTINKLFKVTISNQDWSSSKSFRGKLFECVSCLLFVFQFLGCLIGKVKEKKKKKIICLRTKNLKEQNLQLNAFGCFSSHISSHKVQMCSFLRLCRHWYALHWKNSQ